MEFYVLASIVVALAGALAWIVIRLLLMIRARQPLLAVGGVEWRLGDTGESQAQTARGGATPDLRPRPDRLPASATASRTASAPESPASETPAMPPVGSGRKRGLVARHEVEMEADGSPLPAAAGLARAVSQGDRKAADVASEAETARPPADGSGASDDTCGEAEAPAVAPEPDPASGIAGDVERRIAAQFDDYCAGIATLDDFQAVLDNLYDQVVIAREAGRVDETEVLRANDMIAWSCRWVLDLKLQASEHPHLGGTLPVKRPGQQEGSIGSTLLPGGGQQDSV